MTTIEQAYWHAYEYDIRRKFKSAVAKGLVGEMRQVRRFAEQLDQNFGDQADSKAEFEKIAEAMHTALLDSYDKRVERNKRVASYRKGEDRLSGTLRVALKDPSMVQATANGISYINRPLLDKTARHWRRLNFGASGTRVHGNDNARFPVYFDKVILFYAGSRSKPSPAFSVPKGFWRDASGQFANTFAGGGSGQPPRYSTDRFYPSRPRFGPADSGVRHGQAGTAISGGIFPAHFIDAGFEVLAKRMGPTLNGLYRKWTAEAARFPKTPIIVNT